MKGVFETYLLMVLSLFFLTVSLQFTQNFIQLNKTQLLSSHVLSLVENQHTLNEAVYQGIESQQYCDNCQVVLEKQNDGRVLIEVIAPIYWFGEQIRFPMRIRIISHPIAS